MGFRLASMAPRLSFRIIPPTWPAACVHKFDVVLEGTGDAVFLALFLIALKAVELGGDTAFARSDDAFLDAGVVAGFRGGGHLGADGV